MTHTKPNPLTRRVAIAMLAGTAVNVAAIATTKAAPTLSTLDHQAILARAEQVIDVLRNCVVCHGWHDHRKGLDEEAAERTLEYLRRCAACAPQDDDEKDAEEWAVASEFFIDHGQSLDWIVRGDPGGMICGGAANSARAAAFDDPVFSAIEAHKKAFRRSSDASRRLSRFQEANRRPDGGLPRVEDHPELAKLIAEDASNEIYDAVETLALTVPTTRQGAVALLRYIKAHELDGTGFLTFNIERDDVDDGHVYHDVIDTLLRFLRPGAAAVV